MHGNILTQKIKHILHWWSQRLHVDMTYVAKGGFWLLLANIGESLLSFILAIAFARLMDKASYGVYQYILTLAGLLMIFSLEDMQLAVIQSAARGNTGVIAEAFRKKLRASSLMIVAAIGGGIYYWVSGNHTLALGVLCVGFLQPLMASAGIYRTFFQAKKDFRHFSTYKLIEDLLPGTVIIATLLITKNILWVVFAQFATYLVVRMVLYRRTIQPLRASPSDTHALAYGTQLSAVAIIGRVAKNLDKVIVFHYLGAAELAVYVFAIAFPSYVETILAYALPLALPKFANQHLASLQQTITKKILIVIMLTLPVILLYIVSAPLLFRLFFPQYMSAAPLSQLYALALLASGNLSLAVLVAKKAVKEQLALKTTSTITRLVLMLALVPTYHLWGVVIALIIDRYIYFFLSLFFIKNLKQDA